ncbi:MAG: hypothetical protein HQL12_04825 [Candidatus Omnitrophica bacterium]|nr:hypothetical protein [Candidatus Omnitrophota bacterium]
MTNKHRLETKPSDGGVSFYIDGSLQFDTRDEFIYHESLVIPAASILTSRLKRPFDVLVLGGGDGLALRELLKYDNVRQVDLVDYDQGVIEYAKSQFVPWNKDALSDPRVTVILKEAGEYLKEIRKTYDLIVVDFTFPDRLDTCRLFTEGFYSLIKQRLSSDGLVTLNSISPDLSAPAYWSIFKTLISLKLNPKPLKAKIPSFISHGYGDWGFFFGSQKLIVSRELNDIKLSVPVRYLGKEILLDGMKFPKAHMAWGLSLATVVEEPSDLLCLLNMRVGVPSGDGSVLDFSKPLTYEDLKSFGFSHDMIAAHIAGEWLDKLSLILKSLDWETLLCEIEKNLSNSSSALREEFNLLKREIPHLLREEVFCWERIQKVVSALLVLVIFINMLYPDNVFAKGSGGSGSGEEIVFFSQTQRAAYYALPFGLIALNRLSNIQRPYPTVAYVDKDGVVKNENFFFALTDDLYISEAGRVYLSLPKLLQYEFQVTPTSLILFEKGGSSPVFEFYSDTKVGEVLSQNITVQRKALERTLKDYQTWLSWAAPAQLVFQERGQAEVKDFEKLKKLQVILSNLHNDYSDISSPPEEQRDFFKLAPGVYLSNQRSIMLRKSDGTWVAYPFQGFPQDSTVSNSRPNDTMDRFINALIKAHLSRPETPQAVKAILTDGLAAGQKAN